MDFLTDPFVPFARNADGPVLVTGAGGCIGAWVCAILTAADVPVIAFDLKDDRRRPALIMGEDKSAALTWETGDISDAARVSEVVATHKPRAIIHLAGLQIPFCKANPSAGASVNVLGTINVLEAARAHDIKRTTYASSVASLAMPTGETPWLATLYGVYKQANEQTAKVYWQDWQVPSVGIRPNVVYGVARDQGNSSKFTLGVQAAVLGTPYEVTFDGPTSFLYAGEAASAFIGAVSNDGASADVFDLNGPTEVVADAVALLNTKAPGAQITTSGSAFPFPPDLNDGPLRAHVGDYPSVSVDQGISLTLKAFETLKSQGRLPALPA